MSEGQSSSPFWVVWNQAHGQSTFRHTTEASAEVEARRLAALSPGKEFIVLRSISAFTVPDPVVKQVFDDPDIPF
jgi:hypothetical protein